MQCKNKGCARAIDDDSIYCKWCGTRQVREKRTKDTAPSVKQLPSGSWYCRIRVNGQDVSITRPTKAEAIAEATAVKLGGKQTDAPAKLSLSEAYDAYITDRSGTISPSTEAGYRRLARNTFQSLMPRQVGSLTADQIQREVSAMARTASAKYVRNAEGLLMSVLRQYRPDFTPRLLLPQKTKPDLRQLSDDEIGAVLAAFRGSEVELPVLMALWMGLRVSEILGAKLEDIRGGRLHICRAVVLDASGNATEKPPKTFSGDRWVDIPPCVETLLTALKRESGHIVTMSGAAIYKRFIRGLDAAGIPRCRFHDLRHANAAVMVRLGIDSRYAQERNGWASDRMYKQVYAYTMDDGMAAANAAINAYFADKMAMENQKSE